MSGLTQSTFSAQKGHLREPAHAKRAKEAIRVCRLTQTSFGVLFRSGSLRGHQRDHEENPNKALLSYLIVEKGCLFDAVFFPSPKRRKTASNSIYFKGPQKVVPLGSKTPQRSLGARKTTRNKPRRPFSLGFYEGFSQIEKNRSCDEHEFLVKTR